MAESELGVLSTQCLDRRIPDKQTLTSEIAEWQAKRNSNHAKADWQFTAADARLKLKRLYPQFESLRALGHDKVLMVRIPTKPAMHSNLKPAARSDLKPAIVPI